MVSFTQDEDVEHARVALSSRLARDPAGNATSETGSESYSMNVKTRFESQRGLLEDTKKRGRRHASLHDSSSDEERPADVASIMGANISKQAMAIATQKQNEKKRVLQVC